MCKMLILLLAQLVMWAHCGGVLDGQRVLVTGGGRGIGRAIALLCVQEGARVAVLARSASELDEVSDEAATTCPASPMLTRTADVTNDEAVDAVVASVAEELGGIDVLVNNAGTGCAKGPLHEQSPKAFRELLELNVVSLLSVSSAVLRHAMLAQGRGHIINISSRAGKMGLPGMGPYVASKFAVEGLTATLAAELDDKGILVNSISPGMVDTRSFPKAPGRPGVRSAESIRDGLLFVLESTVSGHYLHVDEYDAAVAAGKPHSALKKIDEPVFSV